MICRKCKEELPESHFGVAGSYRRWVCKMCYRQRERNRQEAIENRKIDELIQWNTNDNRRIH